MTNTSNSGGGPTTTNYGYDAANKLTTAGAKSYAYDGAGNLSSETFNGAQTTYSWDWRNHLIGISDFGPAAGFVYDGMGNRVGKRSAGAKQFILDGKEVAEAIDGSGVATSYVGPGVVSEIQNGIRTVFHADGIGTTRVTTDYNGGIVRCQHLRRLRQRVVYCSNYAAVCVPRGNTDTTRMEAPAWIT